MGSPCGPNNKEKLRKKSLANMIQILVVLTINIMLVFHPSAVFFAYLGDGDISPKGAGLIDIIPGNIKLPNPNKMKV